MFWRKCQPVRFGISHPPRDRDCFLPVALTCKPAAESSWGHSPIGPNSTGAVKREEERHPGVPPPRRSRGVDHLPSRSKILHG